MSPNICQPYYWAIVPVLFTSLVGDNYRIRGPLIVFNALCTIIGVLMLGRLVSSQVTTRYVGTFLATGAYVSNWAALNAFMANNIVGQWKRATIGAAVSACNGLGGVAGSYIVRQQEAPGYLTAVWVSVGYVSISFYRLIIRSMPSLLPNQVSYSSHSHCRNVYSPVLHS